MKNLIFILVFLYSQNLHAYKKDLADAAEGAPAHISKNASYMVWEKSRFTMKVKGSNEFVCLVLRDAKGRFEPSCLNEAAMKSVFPVYEYQTKMLEEGKSIIDIHKNIEDKFNKREFLSPEPGALVYMMSPRNKYYDHFGKKQVDIEPHIMLYLPKTSKDSLGLNGKEGLPGFYDEYPHLSVIHIHTH